MGVGTSSVKALQRRRLTMAVVVPVIFALPGFGIRLAIKRLQEQHAALVVESQKNQALFAANYHEFDADIRQIENISHTKNVADENQDATVSRLMDRNHKLATTGVSLARKGDGIVEERLGNSALVTTLMTEFRNLLMLLVAWEVMVWTGYSVRIFWSDTPNDPSPPPDSGEEPTDG